MTSAVLSHAFSLSNVTFINEEVKLLWGCTSSATLMISVPFVLENGLKGHT